MKKIIIKLLNLISKIIFQLIPFQYKNKTFDIYQEHINKKLKESYEHFEKYFDKSVLFDDFIKIQEYSINKSLSNDIGQKMFYLEFGVWKGESTNFFF